MKRFTLSLAWLAVLASAHAADRPIGYGEFKAGHARYFVITADTADGSVRATTVFCRGVSKVRPLIGSRESACAAITGTFFAPGAGTPIADVMVDGRLESHGRRGSVFAVGYDGKPHIFDTGYGKWTDWSPFRWGVRGAVRLIRNGRPSINPRAQKFHDRRIWGRASRCGVGITRSGKLVFVATGHAVTLSQFARAMLRLGVKEAVNLDGGSSTCLYYRGAVLLRPGRRLSNMLVLQEIKQKRDPNPQVQAPLNGTTYLLNQKVKPS